MDIAHSKQKNVRLRQERIARNWHQADLAELLGTTVVTVCRWEQGSQRPSAYFRVKLCALFGKSAQELGLLYEDSGTADPAESKARAPEHTSPAPSFPSLWDVPYPRNPFFTGREDLLDTLHERFNREPRLARPQSWAISGLGGIGKTQVALEYAYRYRQDYTAVFWRSAATRETLLTGLATIAEHLHLPAKDEQDQNQMILAIKQWFATHQGWLLIVDNADDVTMVQEVLPTEGRGHLLLTTRAQALGSLAQRINVETMGAAEGALLLLRRAKILTSDTVLEQASENDRTHARELVLLMDGLPLALDQAGAYIEEVGCGLPGYLQRYQQHRSSLLGRRGTAAEHPDPVATTWSLSFSLAQQMNQAAVDLLYLCAFLAPEMIAEEILSALAPERSPMSQQSEAGLLWLDGAICILRAFSLVHRSPEDRTLSIHCLVQAVLRDQMDEQTQRHWATRAVSAVNHVFPRVQFSTWQSCQRYLPQALACATLISSWNIVTLEAAHLLHLTGTYLYERAHYAQAEPCYEQAYALYEHLLGRDHPDITSLLESQARLCEALWKEEQAESLYQQVLARRIYTSGPQSPELAESLTNIAFFYYKKGKYEQAEQLCRQAGAIFEQMAGPDLVKMAENLNYLAAIYQMQGRYAEAEVGYQRALAIRKQVFGLEHPEVAASLKTLGALYHEQGRYVEAEPLYTRALTIREQTLGEGHPAVAASLRNLAMLYQNQSKYEEAQFLYQRVMAIRKQVFGTQHPLIADTLTTLGELFLDQGQDDRAKHYFIEAQALLEQTVGPENPDLAYSLHGLAQLACKEGQYVQASELCERILAIRRKTFGENHPEIGNGFILMAEISQAQGDTRQAETLYNQALVIMENFGGPRHPQVATVLYRLAHLYRATGNYQQAQVCGRRAFTIQEEVLGTQHPDTAKTQNLLAELSQMQQE